MLSALLLHLTLAAAPASPTSSWKGDTDGTSEVSITNVNGSIRVEGVEGKTVLAEARGEDGSQARPMFRVDQDGDGELNIHVCCGPCTDEKFSRSCSNPPPVHLVVKVPRGSELNVSAVASPVTVSGVSGPLEITSVSGNVELVPAVLAATEVNTVSGNVKLKLPRGAGAQVEFSSVGGRFNGQAVELGSKSRRYGSGEHEVEVNTVGGALEIQSEDGSK